MLIGKSVKKLEHFFDTKTKKSVDFFDSFFKNCLIFMYNQADDASNAGFQKWFHSSGGVDGDHPPRRFIRSLYRHDL